MKIMQLRCVAKSKNVNNAIKWSKQKPSFIKVEKRLTFHLTRSSPLELQCAKSIPHHQSPSLALLLSCGQPAQAPPKNASQKKKKISRPSLNLFSDMLSIGERRVWNFTQSCLVIIKVFFLSCNNSGSPQGCVLINFVQLSTEKRYLAIFIT